MQSAWASSTSASRSALLLWSKSSKPSTRQGRSSAAEEVLPGGSCTTVPTAESAKPLVSRSPFKARWSCACKQHRQLWVGPCEECSMESELAVRLHKSYEHLQRQQKGCSKKKTNPSFSCQRNQVVDESYLSMSFTVVPRQHVGYVSEVLGRSLETS